MKWKTFHQTTIYQNCPEPDTYHQSLHVSNILQCVICSRVDNRIPFMPFAKRLYVMFQNLCLIYGKCWYHIIIKIYSPIPDIALILPTLHDAIMVRLEPIQFCWHLQIKNSKWVQGDYKIGIKSKFALLRTTTWFAWTEFIKNHI